MRIRARLLRLERAVLQSGPLPVVDDEPLLTDEQDADRTGESLWGELAFRKSYPLPSEDIPSPFRSEAHRAWVEAAEMAWSEGHRDYHAGLHPLALAVWLELKPGILELRRTRGVWIPTGEPVRIETLTPEQFQQLPVDERIAVLREHRNGYWSKWEPPTTSRRRRER